MCMYCSLLLRTAVYAVIAAFDIFITPADTFERPSFGTAPNPLPA